MLSFVIAAYNEENNIERCLQQVLSSSLEFEVIIVDDGSKDSTYEIACNMASHDKRIKVFKQENQGVSAARNKGLAHVKGDWVAFADADDIICTDYLTAFSNYIKTDQYKILQAFQFSDKPYEEHKFISCIPSQFMELVALNRKKYIEKHNDKYKGIFESAHGAYGKIFSVSYLYKNSIQFVNGLGLGEDLLFYLKALEHTDEVIFIYKNIYKIIENSNSSTRRFNIKMVEYTVIFCKLIMDFYRNQNKGKEFYNEMCYQIYNHIEVGITQNILKARPKMKFYEAKEIYNNIYKSDDIINALNNVCLECKPCSIRTFKKWLPIYLLNERKTFLYLSYKKIEQIYIIAKAIL